MLILPALPPHYDEYGARMKRVLLVVPALFILECGEGGTTTVTRASDPTEPVYVAGCGTPIVKPKTISLGCGNGRNEMRLTYSAYGGADASGLGRTEIQSCDPNCGEGRTDTDAAEFDLFRIVKCDDGKRYYSRMALAFTGKAPSTDPDASKLDVSDITPSSDQTGSDQIACERVDLKP